MEQSATYYYIDVIKMFMAFLVVGIHVGAITNTTYPTTLTYLQSIAVPFFFICSGFFLQNKILKTNQTNKTTKQYLLKTLKLYIIWHLIYLPVDLRYMFHENRSVWEDISFYIYLFTCKGETYFTWPLWYLHGLFIAIAIIAFLRSLRIHLSIIWLISIIVMFLGNFERNGFSQGFPYVTTGILIRQYITYLPVCRKKMPLLFAIRIHSILIYFLHMYFVLILYTLFKNNNHPYIFWICVFGITWAIAFVIDKLRQHHYFTWLNHLIA